MNNRSRAVEDADDVRASRAAQARSRYCRPARIGEEATRREKGVSCRFSEAVPESARDARVAVAGHAVESAAGSRARSPHLRVKNNTFLFFPFANYKTVPSLIS